MINRLKNLPINSYRSSRFLQCRCLKKSSHAYFKRNSKRTMLINNSAISYCSDSGGTLRRTNAKCLINVYKEKECKYLIIMISTY